MQSVFRDGLEVLLMRLAGSMRAVNFEKHITTDNGHQEVGFGRLWALVSFSAGPEAFTLLQLLSFRP